MLHVLDHTSYWQSARHDYVILPAGARTASTRLRWWQRLPPHRATGSAQRRLGWSLDNVLVGGMQIAPSSLWETFEQESLDETMWEFHPGGAVLDGLCRSRTGSAMAWRGGHGGRGPGDSMAWTPGGHSGRSGHGSSDSTTGSRMAWRSGHSRLGSSVNMITTCQLIVQQNYIIQFKVTDRQTRQCSSLLVFTFHY